MKEYKTDVCVVGSGGGLVAAVRALEEGASVIVLERLPKPGGNAAHAYGVSAVDSARQRQMTDLTWDKAKLFRAIMDGSKWAADGPIVNAFVNSTGRFMDWITEKGIESKIVPGCMDRVHVSNEVYRATGSRIGLPNMISNKMLEILRASDRAVLLTRTRAEHLIQNEEGDVIGVQAAGSNAEEIRILARSTILATGNFTDNQDMCNRYVSRFFADGLPFEMGDGGRIHGNGYGDGIRMALEAGAKPDLHVDMVIGGPSHHIGFAINTLVTDPFVYLVNKLGRRFAPEIMHSNGYLACQNQPEATVYAICDEDTLDVQLEYMRGNHRELPNEDEIPLLMHLREELESVREKRNTVCKSDTIEGLAEFIGCPAEELKATADRCNAYYDQGLDEEMYKDAEFLRPIRRPPYYAIKLMRFHQCTHGGISINENMEVIKSLWRDRINGLYASGDNASGWCSEYGWQLHTSATWAFNSAFMAGRNAARYALGKESLRKQSK